jgi:hypothetical protein
VPSIAHLLLLRQNTWMLDPLESIICCLGIHSLHRGSGLHPVSPFVSHKFDRCEVWCPDQTSSILHLEHRSLLFLPIFSLTKIGFLLKIILISGPTSRSIKFLSLLVFNLVLFLYPESHWVKYRPLSLIRVSFCAFLLCIWFTFTLDR